MKFGLLLLTLITFGMAGYAQVPDPVGKWTFDDVDDFAKATVGLPLEFKFAVEETAGPTATDKAVKILTENGVNLKHQVVPNGGGEYVNEYTLAFDIRLPYLDEWRALFNTSPGDANEGDLFISPEGNVGLAFLGGYSVYKMKPGEWYRMVITAGRKTYVNTWGTEVTIADFKTYLDGRLIFDANTYAMMDYTTSGGGIDGRYSLDTNFWLFSDYTSGESAEDHEVDCASVSFWGQALTASQVAELGHVPGTQEHTEIYQPWLNNIPYLQTPTPASVYVSWRHDTRDATAIEYGTTASLGYQATGSSEVIHEWHNQIPVNYHTVKLTGLTPATEYYYRLKTGSDVSPVYKFRTLPDPSSTQKLRFLLIGDTQEFGERDDFILSKAKATIERLYGTELHNAIQFVWHVGDLVENGHSNAQYWSQFYVPFRHFSTAVPIMPIAGNHEHESSLYYSYVKYNDISAFDQASRIPEKAWSMQIQNTLFITLNSADEGDLAEDQKHIWDTQITWLENTLKAAEADNAIDFVFVAVHKTPISEMWVEGEMPYVRERVLPLIARYAKVQQLSYGHTHSFERGIYPSQVEGAGDVSIVCVGGGGGTRDMPKSDIYLQKDYPEINISLGDHFFVIGEIDPATQSYQFETYSLGNDYRPLDCERVDSWYGKKTSVKPDQPSAYVIQTLGDKAVLQASEFNGGEGLFSAHYQLKESTGSYDALKMDKIIDARNIYWTDDHYVPVDQNAGLDITGYHIPVSEMESGKTYDWRVRYRDNNRRWSDWSVGNITSIASVHAQNVLLITSATGLIVKLDNTSASNVALNVLDIQGNTVYADHREHGGQVLFEMRHKTLPSGVYLACLTIGEEKITRKVVLK
ncbi:MAG: fibronectin type III domain-containing protein [Dysgonamonadaceae bacterium]|nr:fibronectin type III domain-containing protein [Dysgonamonadaceae bacterium]